MAIPKSKDATLHERITLLQDLNRPLEEHWSVKSRYGLDAKTSDYIYKHHIARLEDIYTHRRFDIKTPVRIVSMSPTAQLYGIHGLKSSMSGGSKHQRKREHTWVNNFQKHHALHDGEMPPRRMITSASAPALSGGFGIGEDGLVDGGNNNNGNTAAILGSGSLQGGLTGSLQTGYNVQENSLDDLDNNLGNNQIHAVRRVQCEDTAPRCDLIAFGLYRLTPSQQETYHNFVRLLAQFDTEDMRHIAEDAVGEAYSDHLLMEFGGVDASVGNAPVFAS